MLRRCYEDGLAARASLAGRVATRFVVERDGTVSSVTDAGSTLPDPNVLACIFTAFRGMRFGDPRGGKVTVVYPIQFNPGD